jgi:hypothetical protein
MYVKILLTNLRISEKFLEVKFKNWRLDHIYVLNNDSLVQQAF